MTCTKCGKQIDAKDAFCAYCGAKNEMLHQSEDNSNDDISRSTAANNSVPARSEKKEKIQGIIWFLVIIGFAVTALVVAWIDYEQSGDYDYVVEDAYGNEVRHYYRNKDEEDESSPYADIDWAETETEYTDSDGYEFNIKYKMSPWMLHSKNGELIEGAWKEAIKVKEAKENYVLPTDYYDWGLQDTGDGGMKKEVHRGNGYITFSHAMDDMYYCVGTVEIENKTEGWSISSSNPRSVNDRADWYIYLPGNDGRRPDGGLLDSSCRAICRVFYSDDYSDEANGIDINVRISGDHVVLPFIMMVPEKSTPNNPEGIRSALRESYFSVKGQQITLDVS